MTQNAPQVLIRWNVEDVTKTGGGLWLPATK